MIAQRLIYPQLYRYILHPCVSWPGNPNMCGGLDTATGTLRFDSFLTQEKVVIMLIYEVGLMSHLRFRASEDMCWHFLSSNRRFWDAQKQRVEK